MLKLRNIKELQRFQNILKLKQTSSVKKCFAINAYKVERVQHSLIEQRRNLFISPPLQKYNKKSGSRDIDTDDEDNLDPEFKDERDSKVVKTKVNSLRADLLLKAGLGIARNKIENIFYESRIRVNGKKLPKKSVQLNEGDEIDVIRGFSHQNPSHLVISRVVILSAVEREEGFSVNFRRYKSLLVDNYSGANAFKSSSVSNI